LYLNIYIASLGVPVFGSVPEVENMAKTAESKTYQEGSDLGISPEGKEVATIIRGLLHFSIWIRFKMTQLRKKIENRMLSNFISSNS